MVITFAPYGNLPYGTTQAYKDLQSCLAEAGVNIDYIIFQTYSIDQDLPMSATVLTDQTAALTKAQACKLPDTDHSTASCCRWILQHRDMQPWYTYLVMLTDPVGYVLTVKATFRHARCNPLL